MQISTPPPGADPGFPIGGGANPPAGAPTYKFVRFSQKLHAIKKILVSGGGGVHKPGAPPLDPPLLPPCMVAPLPYMGVHPINSP